MFDKSGDNKAFVAIIVANVATERIWLDATEIYHRWPEFFARGPQKNTSTMNFKPKMGQIIVFSFKTYCILKLCPKTGYCPLKICNRSRKKNFGRPQFGHARSY
jgi:hypothetical protein